MPDRWEHAFSDPAAAQATAAKIFRQALTHDEVSALRKFSVEVRDEKNATATVSADHGGRRTTYLNSSPSACTDPLILKLRRIMEAADEASSWNLLSEPCNIRCIEFHECTAAGDGTSGVETGAPGREHYDAGSLITLDLMLSESESFDGGTFGTLEADGTMATHALSRGDAVVFVSHKYHTVSPVTRGTREVLVMELWRGPVRHCPHRCLKPEGECTYRGDEAECELLPSLEPD